MYPEDREESRDSRKHVNSRDKQVKTNKDGTTTINYSDGSSAHEGIMVGRTNYDKDTGEEC